jgi:hypothetical protein
MRKNVESIFDLVHRVPRHDHEAFLVALAMTDTLHTKKFGRDPGFAAIAEKAQRAALSSALQRSKDTAGKKAPGAKVSALAWRIYAHRLGAMIVGDWQLLDQIIQCSAPLIALGLQAALEIEKRRQSH